MLKDELRTSLSPYLFEAGLVPDNLVSHRRLLVDGLLLYHVIDKRRMELDDIAKGMIVLMSKCISICKVFFIREV